MTFPGTLGTDPPRAQWPEGRPCPRTILPPSYGCHWSDPQLQSPLGAGNCAGSEVGPPWLRAPVCPQTPGFQQLEEAAYTPAPPRPTPYVRAAFLPKVRVWEGLGHLPWASGSNAKDAQKSRDDTHVGKIALRRGGRALGRHTGFPAPLGPGSGREAPPAVAQPLAAAPEPSALCLAGEGPALWGSAPHTTQSICPRPLGHHGVPSRDTPAPSPSRDLGVAEHAEGVWTHPRSCHPRQAREAWGLGLLGAEGRARRSRGAGPATLGTCALRPGAPGVQGSGVSEAGVEAWGLGLQVPLTPLLPWA
ncbi:uncharacterized protein LOC121478171 [Vulpes lagopus]|uniref:uncharacterized protein LOC121478171 n=1 Tax=Vulpes lagopus TaxID=494514 RepID=UPI001BC8D22B|nr:uncharacterized protein LOC121478171 [Vulpes lagopus]